MKKLNFINKIIFLINNVFAILLLLSFFVPNIKPSTFSLAPIIGLAIPALILINVIFLIYWILIGFRKQFLLSAFVLILSLLFATPIYKFFSGTENPGKKNQLRIMTYNVRKFNSERWINDNSIPKKISTFIKAENPDIVALQEFEESDTFSLDFPYQYNPRATKRSMSGLAIFSKYPIVEQGKVNSKEHPNRAIFVDIIKSNDTIRLYNFHFQSLGLKPNQEFLGQKNSDGLVRRLKRAFKLHEKQLADFEKSLSTQNKKLIITGDMNNTSYSWVYKNLKKDLQDSFLEAGKSFGKTYDFKGFPLRIDYILVDKELNITSHQNFDIKYSDHYPIMATVSF